MLGKMTVAALARRGICNGRMTVGREATRRHASVEEGAFLPRVDRGSLHARMLPESTSDGERWRASGRSH